MPILTRRSPANVINITQSVQYTLALTAEERTRSRYRWEIADEEVLHLTLARGTVLQEGDLLYTDAGDYAVRVVCKPEPVFTVRSPQPLNLLRAAYHLGNRHVPLEVRSDYLRLSPDPVLKHLLVHLDVEVLEEMTPFYPEAGAYHHNH
ncbi:MAG: urease accessory protein UreE [Coleofasciculaceae cyanobacterium SM2_3_26]|nr:urease accessory protein UreE [Coleofasciculaceae cyanobacterium SM2_3_26]